MAARSKTWVCGPSLGGIAVSNLAREMSVIVSVVRPIEVFATG